MPYRYDFASLALTKFAWLMLTNSARNCRLTPSVTATRLNNDASTLLASGPRSAPRDTLPKGPVRGSKKAFGSRESGMRSTHCSKFLPLEAATTAASKKQLQRELDLPRGPVCLSNHGR